MPTAPIDHLLYACADLERGMDEIEARLGTRPVVGGRHPGFGTHNALLSLGPDVYLEIIARDPGLPPPDRGLLVDLPTDAESRLITWVLRVDDIDRAARDAGNAGLGLGAVQPGQRETPEGDVVRWKLTDPYADRMGGALPFLIDWGDTPHPGGVAPAGGRLTGFTLEHPNPGAIRAALEALGSDVAVIEAAVPGFAATVETPNRIVTLR